MNPQRKPTSLIRYVIPKRLKEEFMRLYPTRRLQRTALVRALHHSILSHASNAKLDFAAQDSLLTELEER